MSSSDIDSDSDWEGNEERLEPSCVCLFCSKELEEGAVAVLDHCRVDHGFHLMELVGKLSEFGRNFVINN